MLDRYHKLNSVMQHSYQKIAQQLEHAIRQGQYQTGQRLPSVRSAAQHYQVSIATIIRCYRQLENQGLLEAKSKSGMYVADWQNQPAPSSTKQTQPNKAPPTVEYDKLVSLQHRMTELYSLTAQPLKLGWHLANAAAEWYPCDSLGKIAQKLLRKDPSLIGQYPVGTGLPELKQALINWLVHCGLDLQEDDLLITNGSTEALSIAIRSVAQAGDTVIIESPVYFGVLQKLENLGIKVLAIPCVSGTGISLEALEYALEHQPGVKAIVVTPAFQNPLGCSMPDKNKKRLLKLAEQYDLALIEDDVFGDISGVAERSPAIKAWDKQGRVVYCGSCSKSIAPGFRVGWIAGGRYQARITSMKFSQSLITPLLEQAVLAEFMLSGALPAHLRRLRERLAANIPIATAAVERYFPTGTQIISSAGGWWLWLALPEQIDTLALLRTSVNHGIAFTPGILFSNANKYGHCLRVNIARPWGRDMEQGFKTLGKLAEAMLEEN